MRCRQLLNSLRVILEMLIKLYDNRNDYFNNRLDFCLKTSQAGFPTHIKRRKTISELFCDIDNEQILSFVDLPMALELARVSRKMPIVVAAGFIGTKTVVIS